MAEGAVEERVAQLDLEALAESEATDGRRGARQEGGPRAVDALRPDDLQPLVGGQQLGQGDVLVDAPLAVQRYPAAKLELVPVVAALVVGPDFGRHDV